MLKVCILKKEIKLKYELEKNVNLVKFENNRIEISFNESLDKDFVKDLSLKLFASLLIVVFFIAAFDECLQFFIPRRYPDMNDFLFDVLGGFSGMSLLYLLNRR